MTQAKKKTDQAVLEVRRLRGLAPLVHYTDHHGGTECSTGEVPDSWKRTEDRSINLDEITCPMCRDRKFEERGQRDRIGSRVT